MKAKAMALTVVITAVAVFLGGGALMYGPAIIEWFFTSAPVTGG